MRLFKIGGVNKIGPMEDGMLIKFCEYKVCGFLKVCLGKICTPFKMGFLKSYIIYKA